MIKNNYTNYKKRKHYHKSTTLSALPSACNCPVFSNDPVKFSCQLILILKTELSDIAIHSVGLVVLVLLYFHTFTFTPERSATPRWYLRISEQRHGTTSNARDCKINRGIVAHFPAYSQLTIWLLVKSCCLNDTQMAFGKKSPMIWIFQQHAFLLQF